jgi:DNA helicase-2/ATP-dependent DNA helicase PcrA
VVAGAGSGKTRVITHRIASLVRRGVRPERIAAVTFTNKAAAEMRHRVAGLLGHAEAQALTVGTFHALGLDIIRAEQKTLGLPRGFTVYDAADQLGIVREALRTTKDGDRRYDVKAIQSRISLAKNRLIAPDQYDPNEVDDYDLITAHVYPKYQEALRAFGALDFDDLIVRVIELFREHPDAARRWRTQFQHVLVDEYQDTNRAQLMFLKELVSGSGNVCAVGDDDQSIYSWRGAEPSQMFHFERDFPGARIVVLDQNYRSTQPILFAANAVIAKNTRRRPKTLWSQTESAQKPIVVVASHGEHEARFVAREIHSLVQTQGYTYKDFAILYRSNILAREFEQALSSLDVPFVVVGGQQYFERKEVKDLIAYLRFGLNARDEIALRRILNYPARGIGLATVQRIEAESRAKSVSFSKALEQVSDLGPREATALRGFSDVIAILRTQLHSEGVAAAAKGLVAAIGLYDDIRSASPSGTAAQRRIDNVESLIALVARFEKEAKSPGEISQFLRKLALSEEDESAAADKGNRVTLTTLHGAKGLEFRRVFFIGLEEGILPHARTLMPRATDVVDPNHGPDHATDVEEERRLAYVGITRAMEAVYLCRCSHRLSRGKLEERTPSRFVLEIPADACETRDLAAEDLAPVEVSELSSFFAQLLD